MNRKRYFVWAPAYGQTQVNAAVIEMYSPEVAARVFGKSAPYEIYQDITEGEKDVDVCVCAEDSIIVETYTISAEVIVHAIFKKSAYRDELFDIEPPASPQVTEDRVVDDHPQETVTSSVPPWQFFKVSRVHPGVGLRDTVKIDSDSPDQAAIEWAENHLDSETLKAMTLDRKEMVVVVEDEAGNKTQVALSAMEEISFFTRELEMRPTVETTNRNVEYFVLNELTLCYRQEGSRMLGILTNKFKEIDLMNSPYLLSSQDVLRPATKEDFHRLGWSITTDIQFACEEG
jgi:hypothetical protein